MLRGEQIDALTLIQETNLDTCSVFPGNRFYDQQTFLSIRQQQFDLKHTATEK